MKNEYGQYFTPPHIARLMVNRISGGKNIKILEPSAGQGVFLDELYKAGFKNYLGIEIDTRLKQDVKHPVEHASFVTWRPKEKFEAIIGNPPYVRWKHLEKHLQQELKAHHLWGSLFNSLSDYLSVFIANAIEHLSPGGELIFITPSFWMHTLHTSALRSWMLSRGAITEIIDFGESKVFDGVSSAIIIFKFTSEAQPETIQYWKYKGGRSVSQSVSLNDPEMFDRKKIPSFRPGEHWTLADVETQELVRKLELNAQKTNTDELFPSKNIERLGNYVDIANGMVSGLDRAFRFELDAETDLTAYEKKFLMSVAKAKDLGLLRVKSYSNYINIPCGLSEREVQHKFPNFYEQLESHSEQLTRRYSYGRDLPIWEWAFKRSEKFLTSNKPKIFVPCKERMTNRRTARFAFVEGGVVATQDVTAIAPKLETRESIEYILAYLSTLQVSRWIRVKGLMKGGIAEFSEKPLKEIPFRSVDWNNAKEVEFHSNVTESVRQFLNEGGDIDEFIDNVSYKFAELC